MIYTVQKWNLSHWRIRAGQGILTGPGGRFQKVSRRRPELVATFYSKMDAYLFALALRGMQVWADVQRRRPLGWLSLNDHDEGWPAMACEDLVLTAPFLRISEPSMYSAIQARLAVLGPLGRSLQQTGLTTADRSHRQRRQPYGGRWHTAMYRGASFRVQRTIASPILAGKLRDLRARSLICACNEAATVCDGVHTIVVYRWTLSSVVVFLK